MNITTMQDALGKALSAGGQGTAISFFRHGNPETELTYQELDRDSNRIAHLLTALGVGKGDGVVLFMEKSLIFVSIHLAVQKMGAVSIPLNPGFKKMEMEYLIHDAAPKLVITGTSGGPMINEIDPRLGTMLVPDGTPYQALDFFRSAPDSPPVVTVKPDDPALIIYTSGTTGQPKGAILTQKNLVYDANNVIKTWEITDSDVICHALPLFHVHGLCFALHTALLAGARVVMLDRFSPENVINLLSRGEGDHACTVFMGVPAMYVKLMDRVGNQRLDFGHIRLWTSGSAPLLPKDFQRIKEIFGKEPVEREGMSETGMNFSNPLRGEKKPGSIGLPLPGLGVRIVDMETFSAVEPGQVGEIWLKGPAISPGYLNKPEETARTFHEGWFRTGDLGRVDGDGYYYLTDRCKNIIISGGENISPKEVEGVINRLEGVRECAVVGIRDEKWGEKAVAAVVRKPDSRITRRDLQAHCRKHLHDWKCPREFLFVDELPRNTMGKVLNREVKTLFQG